MGHSGVMAVARIGSCTSDRTNIVSCSGAPSTSTSAPGIAPIFPHHALPSYKCSMVSPPNTTQHQLILMFFFSCLRIWKSSQKTLYFWYCTNYPPTPSPQFGHLGPFSKTMFKRILPSSDDDENDGNDIIVIIIVKKAKTFEQAPL